MRDLRYKYKNAQKKASIRHDKNSILITDIPDLQTKST